jgi:LysR family transcriptional regulator of abg operon
MKEFPKINQLINFQAIIRYGSIRMASQALFQTQPAMTRSIQELERIIGVPLLIRGPQGLILSKMGRIFEPRVNTLLNDLERAVDELHQLSALSQGNVTFGCSHVPAFSFIPSLINKFQENNQLSTITVIEGQLCELITSLRRGRLDLFFGIASPEISMNEFVIEKSINVEFHVIGRNGHPLAHARSLEELNGVKWYFPNTRSGYYKELEDFIFPEGREANNTIIYGDSMSIGEQLVLNEDYLIIGPKAILDISYLEGLISIIPIKEKLPEALYILIYKQQQGLTPIVKQFMNEINLACSTLFSP